MHTANGPFDVKLNPLEAYNRDDGSALGRMSLDKQFHGDLDATSKGEMLSTGVPGPKGSGAYVAIEKVTGILKGRTGTFRYKDRFGSDLDFKGTNTNTGEFEYDQDTKRIRG